MLRAYVRTSRRTGVSLPFWLAIPVGLVWVTVMLMLWLAMAAVWVAVTLWRTAHPA